MKIVERIEAWGHKNITARNRTTLEITKDTHLTLRGDCIIAVNATKGAADLCEEFKELARKEETRITIMLDAGGLREVVNGFGSLSLTFTHPSDLVARKSTFTCSRTLMINCDIAARDFPSDFVKFLKNPDQKIIITLVAED
jgi:hypothetical protein